MNKMVFFGKTRNLKKVTSAISSVKSPANSSTVITGSPSNVLVVLSIAQ
jgi:hypothetical protein